MTMQKLFDYRVATVCLLALTCGREVSSAAVTGPFELALIRVSYTDLTSNAYTSTQIKEAATEIEDFFADLSYGQLDLSITVAEVSVADTAAHHWADQAGLYVAAATLAADAGFDFSGIDGVLFLHPAGFGDDRGRTFWANIAQEGATGYLPTANIWEHTADSSRPPGPSGVWWGGWAHEIGHQLQLSDPDAWLGHPSGYSSGYDLMDSCYPGHVSAYSLLGPPVVSEDAPRKIFPGWLPTSQVVTAEAPDSGTAGETIVLAPLSQHPDESPAAQAIKIPLGGDTYYMVEARRRIGTDALDREPGIWDEGVHITEVVESRNPPVRTIHPCHQDGNCVGGCQDRTNPLQPDCKCGDPPDDVSVDTVPGYCWPYSLWHVSDVFDDPDNDVQIRVDAETGNGFAVTVTRGVLPGRPDLFMIPWLTPPMNTWETIDIWVDSICNGYEEDGGELRDGRRADGTVVYNGDAPCVDHENRIYATIRNGGDAAATDVEVTFKLTDPLGVGIREADGWTEIGTASATDFPALLSLAPGDTTDVYVTWVPEVDLSEADYEEGLFNFHSCVQVLVDAVTGELVTSNQDGDGEQENLAVFEIVFDRLSGSYNVPEKELFLRNLDEANDPVSPRTFYLRVESELPDGWSYTIGNGETAYVLAPGEIRRIPVRIHAPATAPMGESYLLSVEAATFMRSVSSIPDSYPEPSEHFDLEVVAGVLIAAQTVQETDLSLSAQFSNALVPEIIATGSLDPPVGQTIVTVDFTNPQGNMVAYQTATDQAGNFEYAVRPAEGGEWQVRALWQGSTQQSSASKSATVTVPISPPSDRDHDGVPDTEDRCPNTPEGVRVDEWGCSIICGPLGPISLGLIALALMGLRSGISGRCHRGRA